jgi:putative peptidoglycan lipid II flippase
MSSSHNSRVLSMAGGTLVSRATGFLRVLVLAYVLGFTPIADAFNLANTVPNMLFDLVLGGIASATFIPVFVERLAIDGERRAWRSISSVVTGSVVVLFFASVVAWFCAPWIIDGFTALNHSTSLSGSQKFLYEKGLAVSLLRWFVPQIFFYGIIGIATALLNIRKRFGASSWVPVANNVICIGVLFWFHLVDPVPSLSTLNQSHYLVWLGLGTTAGVAIQFLCLTPSLLRSDLGRLRFRLDFHDPAMGAIGRLGSWTLLVVLANQASLYVVIAFAVGLGGNGPVSAYTYGWTFMQMPYAVVVVSVLGALTPQLAAHATDKDFGALSQKLRMGLRQSLVIIIPCTVVLLVLAQPIVSILLEHMNASHRWLVGSVLAVLAAGLPGFTVFQLAVRGLQAMQRARDVFILYFIQNGLTIALCIMMGRHSIAGLVSSISIAYSAAAILALAVLRRYEVSITSTLWSVYVLRSLVASLISGVVMAIVYAVPSSQSGIGLLYRTGISVVFGVLSFVSVVLVQTRNTTSA